MHIFVVGTKGNMEVSFKALIPTWKDLKI